MSTLINQAEIVIVNGFIPDSTDYETYEIPCEVIQHGESAFFTIKDDIYWTEQSLLQALELVRQHQRRINVE